MLLQRNELLLVGLSHLSNLLVLNLLLELELLKQVLILLLQLFDLLLVPVVSC